MSADETNEKPRAHPQISVHREGLTSYGKGAPSLPARHKDVLVPVNVIPTAPFDGQPASEYGGGFLSRAWPRASKFRGPVSGGA